ncbi:hypothetical protein MASR1M31_11300 [Porphyromonadaceae bacterium]
MGSLDESDLSRTRKHQQKQQRKAGRHKLNQDQLYQTIRRGAYGLPRVGYPPLVTPFSQYVKNLAMMNDADGKERALQYDC